MVADKKLDLDAVDLSILRRLSRDGRMKIRQLAEELNLSYSPVFERVKRLEREGYIAGYRAQLNHEKFGGGLIVFCAINLEKHILEQIQTFENEAIDLDGVEACYHMAGVYDYLLKIRVKDMEAYKTFLAHDLAKIKNISRVQSSFVMAEVQSPPEKQWPLV